MQKIKAVFNWSGGKDSALALHKILQSGEYEVSALLTMIDKRKRSSFHAIPLALLERQAESIGIPLRVVETGTPDGLSDYAAVTRQAAARFREEGVSAFIFGDVSLHDVRVYREQILSPEGISVVEPLWHLSPEQVMEEYFSSGLRSVIVTTTASALGEEYVGRSLTRELVESFPPGVDVCGENGEYHTFCHDGPLFSFPVPFRLGTPSPGQLSIRLADGREQAFSYWYAGLEA